MTECGVEAMEEVRPLKLKANTNKRMNKNKVLSSSQCISRCIGWTVRRWRLFFPEHNRPLCSYEGSTVQSHRDRHLQCKSHEQLRAP